jgi:hypothetical protein
MAKFSDSTSAAQKLKVLQVVTWVENIFLEASVCTTPPEDIIDQMCT